MSGRDLICRGLVRTHGRRVVLSGVDVDVRAGTSLVLLGSSGAGKTTLLRIVAGLDRGTAGTVSLGGSVLSDPAILVPPESRRIGMVFQALELWPHMTVAEHIAFGLPGRPRGRRARKNATVLNLAEQTGLSSEILRRKPTTLSGGEQQRVALARAVAGDPKILLADEPTGNLDGTTGDQIIELMFDLHDKRGTTLVLITHDTELAEACNRVVRLKDGLIDVIEPGRRAKQTAAAQ